MTPYIDIHTHRIADDPQVKEVLAPSIEDPLGVSTVASGLFCYGLHPWAAGQVDRESFYSQLKLALQSPCFFALGEIGLDRARKENWQAQLAAFREQLEFARQHDVKRIVIHCVRAYFDILPELQRLKSDVSIVLHDYNSNLETAKRFMDSLDVYFSFGSKLFTPQSQGAKCFPELDINRVFLETDDNSSVSIFEVYQQAAALRAVSLEELKTRLYANFKRICLPNTGI